MGEPLNVSPLQESAMAVVLTFTDVLEEPFEVPSFDSADYQLSKPCGEVINGLTFASSAVDDSGVIILSGDDLQITDRSDNGERVLTIQIQYDSSYKEDLAGRQEFTFTIQKAVNA